MSTIVSDIKQTNMGEEIEKEEKKRGGPPSTLLNNHGFKLLWIGEGISQISDQFYMIALPWLVYDLTDSVVLLGIVGFAGLLGHGQRRGVGQAVALADDEGGEGIRTVAAAVQGRRQVRRGDGIDLNFLGHTIADRRQLGRIVLVDHKANAHWLTGNGRQCGRCHQ